MTKILIKTVAGAQCGTEFEGTRLRDQLLPLLSSGETVELDFEGVGLASSTFFNASIGHAYNQFGAGFLRDHVTYSNVKSRVQFVLDRTLRTYVTAV